MNPTPRPSLEEMEAAAERIRPAVVQTPLVPLHTYEPEPSDILLKPEIHQVVSSFKIRGIFNAVCCLDESQRRQGLSTVSAGNTAQALAWSARYYGVQARSLMPEGAPRSKIDAVRAYGGTPVLVPTEEVFRFLKEHGWEDEPYAFIHPWTDPAVLTGHASMGLEILADCPDVESVFVSVGGGGLIAGVASALKTLRPAVRIIAVEPESCASLHASLAADAPTEVDCRTELCDGVAVPYITHEMFPLLREVVDDVVLTSDQIVRQTIRRLALQDKMVVEGSGALTVAAALARPREERGKSVCVLTGGSIDAQKLASILAESS